MCGIAENLIHHEVRRAARHPARELEGDVSAEAASPSLAMRREERFDRLQSALETLRPDHREVVLLVRVEGLSFEEVGRRMGRSPDAVKQLLWRALKKLKSSFGDTESIHLPDRSLMEDRRPREECPDAP
jgi:RNA polymerase sigma-70 factor (ECF subfamily)